MYKAIQVYLNILLSNITFSGHMDKRQFLGWELVSLSSEQLTYKTRKQTNKKLYFLTYLSVEYFKRGYMSQNELNFEGDKYFSQKLPTTFYATLFESPKIFSRCAKQLKGSAKFVCFTVSKLFINGKLKAQSSQQKHYSYLKIELDYWKNRCQATQEVNSPPVLISEFQKLNLTAYTHSVFTIYLLQ